jgi:Lar family restriction alleviation protein
MSELKPCPFCGSIPEVYDSETDDIREEDVHWVSVCCKCGAEPFRHIYSDNVNEDTKQAYRDKCISKWNTRTPAPAEVERLVDDLLSVSKQLGQSEARGLYDHIEPAEVAINDLKSRILVALSNTTPYLSRDVNVPVEKLEAGKEYDMTVRVRIESDVAKMETKPCLWVVIDGDSRKLEAWLRHAKPTFRKVGE